MREGTHFTPLQAISNYHARRAPRAAVGPIHRAAMRILVLLLASASALVPTADGMSGARPLTRAPALGRPRPVYRLAPSQLCAVQPLPPAPVSRLQQVVGSGSWRVGAVTALICLDILCYSFPLPFMPEFLASRCVRHPHSPRPRTRALTPAQPRPPARAYAHACTRAQGPHAARHLGAALLLLLRRARLGRDHRGGAVDAACARRRCGPPPVRAACDGGHGDGGGERGAGDAAIVRCAEPKPAP